MLNTGYFYILGTILFTVLGQLILKWRISSYGSLPEATMEKLFFLLKLLYDPFILSGFIFAFISAIFWMATMTRYDLSQAYPIVIAGLAIFTSIVAIIILRETFTFYKILGISFIVIGVYFSLKAN